MAVIENDVIKVTVSNSNTRNVIQVSPGVSALSSVSLSLNDLNNVNTSGITNGQTIVYDNGSFVAGDSGAVETINGEAPDSNGDVTIDFSVDGLTDVDVTSPSVGDILKYETNRWVNDSLGKSDVGLANVDNTSDADKPISTATQTALDVKANTSSVPASLTDLSDVSIVGTPSGNQALIYDVTAGAFKSLVSYTNRFEDEVENGKQMPTIFAERAYSVKAEGDGVFIDPESDTPAAGKVIVRKIYHKTGFITDADVIGDYTLIHTFADDTAYADTVATFEGFEDGATYGVPPFTLLQTWEEVTAAPAFTGLLNETYGSGAAAAYSTRRLNGNYTGAAIQVERSSDNSYQDIGFDANGDLDESALTTFCTGTTCKVRTWYGQEASGGTGSGNDAQQTDHTKQPTIYTGGAIVRIDGKPAFTVDGSNDNFNITALTGGQYGIFTVGKPTSLVGYYTDSTTGSRQYILRNNTGYTINGSFNIYNSGTQTTQLLNNQKELVSFLSNSTTSNYINKLLTRTNGSQSYAGDFSEFIIYTSDKSTDRTQIESNIGDYFTQNTPLLDTYSGAAAAYSLRLLDSTYTGSAIRVRRDNNDEQDIGFNVFGELDTVSLLAFAGASGNAWVKIWYDKSTNGNDATQSVATNNQPQIVSGGSVITRGTENKPSVLFTGSTQILPIANSFNNNTYLYVGQPLNRSQGFGSLGKSVRTDGVVGYRNASFEWAGANLYVLHNGTVYDATSGGNISVNLGFDVVLFRRGSVGTPQPDSIGFENTQYISEIISYSTLESDSNLVGISNNANEFYQVFS